MRQSQLLMVVLMSLAISLAGCQSYPKKPAKASGRWQPVNISNPTELSDYFRKQAAQHEAEQIKKAQSEAAQVQ